MQSYFCNSCGLQYPPAETPPANCVLCEDERHLVGPGGQSWSTLAQIARKGANLFRETEPNLIGIGPIPAVGIGQRALLVRTPEGNILWDCVPLIDRLTVELINGLGGLKAIAVSHPHYYSGMVEWSRAFGGVPILLHGDDRKWAVYRDPAITFWEGDRLEVVKDLTLIRVGGHFAGGSVAHWSKGSNGKGSLLAGDLVMITADKKWASFMRSFPNSIPLSAAVVSKIGKRLEPLAYDTVHGPFFDRVLGPDAKSIVARSIERYVKWANDDGRLAAQ